MFVLIELMYFFEVRQAVLAVSDSLPVLVGIFMTAVLGPVIVSRSSNHQLRKNQQVEYELRRQEREEDRRYQERVNEEASAQRSRLAVQNDEIVARQVDQHQVIKALDLKTEALDHKADVTIHLVDGSMTAAMQHELEATKREYVWMREVIKLQRAGGQEPDAAMLAEVDTVRKKIVNLQEQYDIRVEQVRMAVDKKAEATTIAQAGIAVIDANRDEGAATL